MLAINLVALAGTASAQVLTYPRGASARLEVAIHAPSGRTGILTRSELVRGISDTLRAHTDLDMVEVDPGLVARCAGVLACMVLETRRDYDRLALENPDGSLRPIEDHEHWIADRKVEYSRYLLVVTLLTGDEITDGASILLIDTAMALRVLHAVDRRDSDWQANAEGDVVARAALLDLNLVVVDAAPALKAIALELEHVFDVEGRWEPFGEIEIAGSVAGGAIEIDGTPVGASLQGVTRVVRVPLGLRKLTIVHPRYEVAVAEADVRRAEVARLDLTLTEKVDSSRLALWHTLLWTGVVSTVVGIGLVAASAAEASAGETVGYCFHTPSRKCEGGRTFDRFGAGAATRASESGNAGGVALGPVGLSFIGLGLTWSLTTWLLGDPRDIPWIQALAGAIVFGATLGLSLALDGDDPVAVPSEG